MSIVFVEKDRHVCLHISHAEQQRVAPFTEKGHPTVVSFLFGLSENLLCELLRELVLQRQLAVAQVELHLL